MKNLTKYETLVGKTFGLLHVDKIYDTLTKNVRYLCTCSCGTTNIVVPYPYLINKNVQNCGCNTSISEFPTRMSIVGQKFSRLTVKAFVGINNRRRPLWLCECECQNATKVIVGGDSLKDKNTLGCGCIKTETNPFIKNKKGPGVAAANQKYQEYKVKAKQRGHIFSLSEETFFRLTKENCYYCGRPAQNVSRGRTLNGSYTYTGLDRIDNTQGYLEENVVPCCKDCNSAKTTLTQSTFFNLVQRIYENRLVEHNVLVAASGASGQIYTKTLLDFFVKEKIKFDFLFSSAAEQVAQQELLYSYREFLQNLGKPIYDITSFNAPSASSSTWKYSSMIIVPASMGATSRIAKGLSSNLIERSFDVALAMKIKTILVPREGVFITEHLSDMLTLSQNGTIIAPACPSFYSGQQTYDDIIKSVVGKLLSLLGIKNSVRTPWTIPIKENTLDKKGDA